MVWSGLSISITYWKVSDVDKGGSFIGINDLKGFPDPVPSTSNLEIPFTLTVSLLANPLAPGNATYPVPGLSGLPLSKFI